MFCFRHPTGLQARGATAPRRPAAHVACWLLLLCLLPLAAPAAVNQMEYQLKAGFLVNFAKFVEWPGTSLVPGADLRLGIIAPDEVFAVMEKSLAGKSAGNHVIKVEHLTMSELESAPVLPQIVFIHQEALRTRGEIDRDALFRLAEKQAVLLVGESAGFAPAGGSIGFVQRGENLRFQVNLASAQQSGLKLSSRLSGLAEIVSSSTQ